MDDHENHTFDDEFDPEAATDDSGRLMTFSEGNKTKQQALKRRCVFVVLVATILAAITVLVVVLVVTQLSSRKKSDSKDPYERAAALLDQFPLIDG